MKTRMVLCVMMTVFLVAVAAGAFAQDTPGAGDGTGPLHDEPMMAGPGFGGPMGGEEGQFGAGGGPHAGRGLLFCNRHLYYEGDELILTVCLPEGVQDLINNNAVDLYLLVFSEDPLVQAIPLDTTAYTPEEPCLEILYADLADVPEADFQLALVLADGTPASDVNNWHEGLRGLAGVCGLRLNPENAPEDANRDGFMDGNQAGIGGTVIP